MYKRQDRIDAICQKPSICIVGSLDLAVYKDGWNQKSACREIKDIFYKSLNIACIAGAFCPADIFIHIAVKLGEDRAIALQKRPNLRLDHSLKFFRPAFFTLGQLGNVHLPVLAFVPLVITHGRVHQPVIALVQPVDDRLDICLLYTSRCV